jgi:hypothetical protein
VQAVNRNSGYDRRLAGINYMAGDGAGTISNRSYFRVDLPEAGTYEIHLANGDTYAQENQYLDVRDTTAAVFALNGGNTSANHYLDANGTNLTNAEWAGSERGRTATFTTTQLRIYPGTQASGTAGVTTLAHLRILRTQ